MCLEVAEQNVHNNTIGVGEFQLKNVHIKLTVEVIDDVVFAINCPQSSGIDQTKISLFEKSVIGKRISNALHARIGSRSDVPDNDSEDVVILEAFHRALEEIIE